MIECMRRKDDKKMNQIERLYKNLIILIDAEAFNAEFQVFVEENPDVDSLNELNEIIESEISYWADSE